MPPPPCRGVPHGVPMFRYSNDEARMETSYCNKTEVSAACSDRKPNLHARVPAGPQQDGPGFLKSLTPGKVASGVIGGGIFLLGLRRGGLMGGVLQSIGGLV